MDNNNQETKKCFCSRCFLPINLEDKVDIEDQNFHRICSMCCVCRTIPSSLKMFYGHVFCNDCFKSHVLSRFKGDNTRMTSNSWWMQAAPGSRPQDSENKGNEDNIPEKPTEEPTKRSICARCLQSVDENYKVTIGDQSFHGQCAKCYFCHKVPTSNLKIYYGQVFCEECFHRNVLNRNQDNPSEFFKNCFEQWQNNAQFAENMREFMSGNNDTAPFIFMMQGQQPPFCRCGTGPQEWYQPNEPRKSATLSTPFIEEDFFENSFGNGKEIENSLSVNESANQNSLNIEAAEKIEKLTKYLHNRYERQEDINKTWEFVEQKLQNDAFSRWTNLQSNKLNSFKCPKCLWQCGAIYVDYKIWKQQLLANKNKFE
ncbi:unnamed protein product [Euphydryas editha]|uniref:LIM zinc-binding domain-containing protein n=1 Tax=Euphydryas editha TaxID=104508 RepID=A0AAU9UVD8_EUPED|nr:unnamed protein product [Euphydryas editha]